MTINPLSLLTQIRAPSSSPTRTESAAETTEIVYRREISAISPGSWANAYQAIRSLEVASSLEHGAQPYGDTRAIVTGVGVPGALQAYVEIMGTDE